MPAGGGVGSAWVRVEPAVLARAFAGLAVVTYGLLVFGASVRVHGAGLACPDWPLCFGEVVPRFDFRIFLEWGHRVLASVVSLGFLVAGGLVLYRREARALAGRLVAVAAVVLAIQVILGGLTVLHLLAFWSVTLHLLTGNLFLVLLVLTGLRLRDRPVPVASQKARALVAGLAVAVLAQMALGGLVSSNYAGLACGEWPACRDGAWFPPLDLPVLLQLLHRAGAYAVLALAGALFALARREVPVAGPLLAFVIGQAALGVANVLLRMPVELAILHSATADLIVVLTTFAAARAFAKGASATALAPAMGAAR